MWASRGNGIGDGQYCEWKELHDKIQIRVPEASCEREIPQIFGEVEIGPVSYTHLDVYKRQIECCLAQAMACRDAGLAN